MALTPFIRASGLNETAVTAKGVPFNVSNLNLTAIIAFPTPFIRASQLDETVVTVRGVPFRVSQLNMTAVVKGHVENPKLRTWGFTMDGHDFYVLRLGDGKTLVYDLSTQTWSNWSSESLDYWRPNRGMNWKTYGGAGVLNGSNVVVGDDTFGLLWILDPLKGTDDNPNGNSFPTTPYTRTSTAQMISRERKTVPVFEVYLTASFGNPSVTGGNVTLSYSDDLGRTYISAGTIAATPGDYNQEFAWRSLGLVQPSGRIFRITDNGAFDRIDSLDVVTGAS